MPLSERGVPAGVSRDLGIPAWEWVELVRDEPSILGTRLLVAMTYATYAGHSTTGPQGPDRPVWPSNETVGRATGLNRSTVNRHTRQLVESGYLTAVHRRSYLAAGLTALEPSDARTKAYLLTRPHAVRG